MVRAPNMITDGVLPICTARIRAIRKKSALNGAMMRAIQPESEDSGMMDFMMMEERRKAGKIEITKGTRLIV